MIYVVCICCAVVSLLCVHTKVLSDCITLLKNDVRRGNERCEAMQERIDLILIKARVHDDRLNGLGKRDDDQDRLIRALTPEAIFATLRRKEAFLDAANERIDNGIGNARSAGQAAGEDAARTLVRQCIDNAIAGKGPPMQILRPDMSAGVLAAKLKTGKRGGE